MPGGRGGAHASVKEEATYSDLVYFEHPLVAAAKTNPIARQNLVALVQLVDHLLENQDKIQASKARSQLVC